MLKSKNEKDRSREREERNTKREGDRDTLKECKKEKQTERR